MTFSKKIIKPLVFSFLAVYFFYLVFSRAPAELAASAVHSAAPQVWLTGVEGTVWRGTAASAQVDLPTEPLALGAVRWKLSAFSLLMLNPCVDVEASRPGLLFNGRICRSITGVTSLENASLETTVAPLSDLLPVKVRGSGSVQVLTGRFKETDVNELDARVSWQNGSVHTGESWMAVGSYAATLNEAGNGGVQGKLFDIDAPLKVDMAVSWQLQQGWKTDGTVEPVPSAPDLLKGGVQLIGEELEPGVYKVIWP